MKKNITKRLTALALGIVCICSVGVSYAENNDGNCSAQAIGGTASPMYTGISSTTMGFDINSNGSLYCSGSTSAWSGYKAGVVVELQKNDGGWTTIKTWSDYDDTFAAVDNNWFVEDGYSYRLKITHYAYDSNWNQVYSVVKYSRTIIK